MRDLIQALGGVQRLYVLSIGGPCEAGYRLQVQRGIRQLSTDISIYQALGISISTYSHQDITENAMLIGMRLLSVYLKNRDEAERRKAAFDFEELENIYYAASAFITTAEDWKQPPVLS